MRLRRRDPRARRPVPCGRQALLNAARALVADEGRTVLSVAEVTTWAGVGRATFYRHFESTKALLDALDQTRIGDLEREGVVALLQENFVAGRLDIDELSTRAEQVYRAQRWGDVRSLLADLPALR